MLSGTPLDPAEARFRTAANKCLSERQFMHIFYLTNISSFRSLTVCLRKFSQCNRQCSLLHKIHFCFGTFLTCAEKSLALRLGGLVATLDLF